MIIHPSQSRGHADHGWLKSHHTFSFAGYHDPARMGFGALRVINDDAVAPGTGFGRHPHKDMEIITVPLRGSLQHQDSEGNSSVIRKGEVQIMSAGTGIFHSEFNASTAEPVELLQIWILPKKLGVKPRYEQKDFDLGDDGLTLVVSPEGEEGSVIINQDAYFSLGKIHGGRELAYSPRLAGNGLYVFVISGKVEVDGQMMAHRDGAGVDVFQKVVLKGVEDAEVLLMEVPMGI